jgi:hypothetical protein
MTHYKYELTIVYYVRMSPYLTYESLNWVYLLGCHTQMRAFVSAYSELFTSPRRCQLGHQLLCRFLDAHVFLYPTLPRAEKSSTTRYLIRQC